MEISGSRIMGLISVGDWCHVFRNVDAKAVNTLCIIFSEKVDQSRNRGRAQISALPSYIVNSCKYNL